MFACFDQRRGLSANCIRTGTRTLAGSIFALTACLAGAETTYGPSVALGDGMARVYLVTEDEVPVELGVALDDAFLSALPADGEPHGIVMPDGRSTFEYMLEMPAGHGTPFQHVTLDWNPSGHEPDGIYDLAHLDIHFYVISVEERLAIDPTDPEFPEKARRLPDAAYLPAGYVDPGAPPVPMMGLHLVDPASPELHPDHPEPFTYTFLYGSWDGRLIFLEPMVTTEYLRTKQPMTRDVPVAAHYQPPGYYPGAYSIRWDEHAGEHRIALNDLQWR